MEQRSKGHKGHEEKGRGRQIERSEESGK